MTNPGATPSASAAWRLRLLGGFELQGHGQRHTRLTSRVATLLLARLALAPGVQHSREALAATLWPEADADIGRARLRQALSTLRALLEPAGSAPLLQADRQTVRLPRGAVECDATQLDDALRAGHAATALALAQGELLPGFHDEWIADERRRLQSRLERLAEQPLPTRPPAPGASPLPQFLTRLIGAEEALAALAAQVSVERLVTVLGAGGAGKTRLAVEAARALVEPGGAGGHGVDRFERAVFVSLIDVVHATALLDALRAALRIEASGEAVEQITGTLDGRRLLMLLDNAETLDAAAAATLARLAERLPRVHWLVTSRQPLQLDGETQVRLGPLPLPATEAGTAEVAANPAVRLFVDRALAHRADFHVGAHNRGAVAALVRWLEGLPLALELAAAQVRTLEPAELLALLQTARDEGRSLALLSRRGSRSGHDGRHASMQAVVDWTWRLLDDGQRALLQALALLPGGATLDTAAALLAAPQADTQRLVNELDALSVLRSRRGADGVQRHAPLEPVREHVLVLTAPAAAAELRQRHRAWLQAWVSAMPPTPPLSAVREELPAIALALAQAVDDGAAADALDLVLSLQSAWGEIALPDGVLASLQRVLASPGLDPARAANGHALAATFSLDAGRREAARVHVAAAFALPCTEPRWRASTLSRLSRLVWRLDGDGAQARALVDEALPLARASGRANTVGSLLATKAMLLRVVDGDAAAAAECSRESRALWAASGNRHLINAGRYNAAVQAVAARRPAQALAELVALEAEGRELQDWDLCSGALEARGTALAQLRRWPEAWEALREAVAVAWDGFEALASVYALWKSAPVLLRLGHTELALQTLGAADAQWRARFGQPDRGDLRDIVFVRRGGRLRLGPAEAAAAWQRGAALPLGQAVRALLAWSPTAA